MRPTYASVYSEKAAKTSAIRDKRFFSSVDSEWLGH